METDDLKARLHEQQKEQSRLRIGQYISREVLHVNPGGFTDSENQKEVSEQ